jgi:hypothetical protein
MKKAIIYTEGTRRDFWMLEEECEFGDALKQIEFHSVTGSPEIIGIVSYEQADACLAAQHINTPDPAAEGERDAIENVPELGGAMEGIKNAVMNMKPANAWKILKAKTLCQYFYYQATQVQDRKFGIDAAVEAFHIVEQHFWDTVTETKGGNA